MARKTYSRRAGRWLERHGGALLLWCWSRAVRLTAALASALEHATLATWRWSGQLGFAGRLGLVAGLVLAVVVGGPRLLATLTPPPSTSDNVLALARVIRSEVGGSSAQHRVHVAWATRNLARERGESIAEMACSPCGPQGPARPVSSRQEATEADLALAAYVLDAPALLDPTAGASHFLNPALQDRLARSGALPGYLGRTYQIVHRRWRDRYGWEPYYRLGPDLELWGPRRRRAGR